jgi:hypothetical protein
MTMWKIERPLVFLLYILFLNISIYYIHQIVLTRSFQKLSGFHFLIITIVLSASVVQAIMENSDNNLRFSLNYQPVMIYVTIVSVWGFFFPNHVRSHADE